MDLLTFFEHTMKWCVPLHTRAWARQHVAPGQALRLAHPVHLMWLSSRCRDIAVTMARIEVRAQYACAQYDPDDQDAAAALHDATESLRSRLDASPWWAGVQDTWDAHQTHGLGVVRYEIQAALPVAVRGTAVGSFAVREVPWLYLDTQGRPPLGHREQTPERWRNASGPRFVYEVDHVATGKAIGSFCSARVAFEVARSLDAQRVAGPPCPTGFMRVLDAFAGWPTFPEAPSWPAEPHWRFAVERLSQQRSEVRHAV